MSCEALCKVSKKELRQLYDKHFVKTAQYDEEEEQSYVHDYNNAYEFNLCPNMVLSTFKN